jgi:REP element-mobilizing transposase RayT
MWNLTAPPGFRGLRPDADVTMYVRHLPYWRQPGATYFVTFRLGDSLPQAKLRELAAWRAQWQRRHPPPHSDEIWQRYSHEVMRRIEVWLDQGMGSCLLRQPEASATVCRALHQFDSQRYELASYIIMPNHVHVLVRPLDERDEALERILHSWKRYAAHEINLQRVRRGPLWQEESFDRIVRDEEHLYRCLQYIGSNAARAGLPLEACPRWARPDWESLGWGFAAP